MIKQLVKHFTSSDSDYDSLATMLEEKTPSDFMDQYKNASPRSKQQQAAQLKRKMPFIINFAFYQDIVTLRKYAKGDPILESAFSFHDIARLGRELSKAGRFPEFLELREAVIGVKAHEDALSLTSVEIGRKLLEKGLTGDFTWLKIMAAEGTLEREKLNKLNAGAALPSSGIPQPS